MGDLAGDGGTRGRPSTEDDALAPVGVGPRGDGPTDALEPTEIVDCRRDAGADDRRADGTGEAPGAADGLRTVVPLAGLTADGLGAVRVGRTADDVEELPARGGVLGPAAEERDAVLEGVADDATDGLGLPGVEAREAPALPTPATLGRGAFMSAECFSVTH